jgi:hypothetical protein
VFLDKHEAVAYDPNYSAGYLKTPWFDAGSKPAELSHLVVGGRLSPAAYKQGLFLSWLVLPLLLAWGVCSAGGCRAVGCLTAAMGIAVSASHFGRQTMHGGDLDLVLGAGLSAWYFGLLIAFHRSPRALTWLGSTLAGSLACLVQPYLAAAFVPVVLLYYFAASGQQRPWWHGALWLVMVAIVGCNWPWLKALAQYWWLATEVEAASPAASVSLIDLLAAQGLLTADPLHQGLALGLLGLAVVGVAAAALEGKGPFAGMFGAAVALLLVLAIFGPHWGPLAWWEPQRLLFPALLLATVPTGRALSGLGALLQWGAGSTTRAAAAGGALLLAAGFALHEPALQFARSCMYPEPLLLGLPAEEERLVTELREATTAQARILWEETPDADAWTPLLAHYTNRQFVGGLGVVAAIEPATARLVQGRLLGRPLQDWQKLDFEEFARQFNIGWVVGGTAESLAQLRKWYGMESGRRIGGGSRWLFALPTRRSFVLAGSGHVVYCDQRQVTFEELRPTKDGQLVLSFHYHPRMAASIDRVRIDKQVQRFDGVPLVRLHLPGEMSRLTIYWLE